MVSLVVTESMSLFCPCDLLCFLVHNFNMFHISALPVSVTKQYRIGSATQFRLVSATVILYTVKVCFPDLSLKFILRSKMQRMSTITWKGVKHRKKVNVMLASNFMILLFSLFSVAWLCRTAWYTLWLQIMMVIKGTA